MWRLPGLLGRALHRFHASNVQSSLHAAPAPCAEVEALNSTTLLPVGQSPSGRSFHSSNFQNGQNGSGRQQEKKFRPFSCPLPQYSVLDAFGWGAVAAVFLHLSKQITSRDSLPTSSRRDGSSWPSYLDGLLASVLRHQSPAPQRYILPNEARGIHLDGRRTPSAEKTFDSSTPGPSSSGGFTSSSEQETDPSSSGAEESEFTSHSSVSGSEPGDTWTRQGFEVESGSAVSLEDAASRLQDVSQSSVAVVLNIIGIGSARETGDYTTAFSCFHTAASRGYSKAQYNTGVCYEQGNGVPKDLEKAAVYYHLAASNGHRMALYRYARYLLDHKAGVDNGEWQKAVEMLEQVAEAGLKEAQAYLGVLYTKDSHLDPQKAVKYLWKAAENGDVQSRFHLGVCYESGFGVQLNLAEAIKHYEKAALRGHKAAREVLNTIYQKQLEDLLNHRPCHLKAAASCPCLASLDRVSPCSEMPRQTLTLGPALLNVSPALHLPHSQSTGSLRALAEQFSAHSKGTVSCASLGPLPLSSLRAIGVG